MNGQYLHFKLYLVSTCTLNYTWSVLVIDGLDLMSAAEAAQDICPIDREGYWWRGMLSLVLVLQRKDNSKASSLHDMETTWHTNLAPGIEWANKHFYINPRYARFVCPMTPELTVVARIQYYHKNVLLNKRSFNFIAFLVLHLLIN